MTALVKQLCAATLAAFIAATLHAQVVQNFDSWPAHLNFTNSTHEGWSLTDGKIAGAFGGHGAPVSGNAAWLNDVDANPDSWLRSPVMDTGIDRVTFLSMRNSSIVVSNTFVVEYSVDSTNWNIAATFTNTSGTWERREADIEVLQPASLRMRTIDAVGANAFLGLEDIDVILPSLVLTSNLMHDPETPTTDQNVDVRVDAVSSPLASNVVLRAWYRHNPEGPFTERIMAPETGNTWKTVEPIPFGAGFDGSVQYFVEITYNGPGPSPVYVPDGGSNAPAAYTPINPFANTAPRQLSPGSQRTAMIISEVMYHPRNSGTNSLEFIEIFNTEPVARDISGYRVRGSIAYTFPSNAIINARSFAVIARDPAALAAHYNLETPYGPFTGALPNQGSGTVRLENRWGAHLVEVIYEDRPPWPIAADGAGHSLLLASPDYGIDDIRAWTASAYAGGSPGTVDPFVRPEPQRTVVINEYLAHTDLPQTDFIELYNHGGNTVDLSGAILSDRADLDKFVLPPGTLLAPGAFIAYDQATMGFSLSSHGDNIFLSYTGATGRFTIDAVQFAATQNGISSGRYPDGADGLYELMTNSPAASNTTGGALRRDVVINEIMYAPISGKEEDAYVELYNRGTASVNVSHWQLVDGVTFLIPDGTVIPSGGYLVIASDKDNLIPRYDQLTHANTLGNYQGKLSNRGERIALAKPDNPALPFDDLVVVDEVTYSDGWGEWADAGGSSLELIDPRADNRLEMNWAGSDETQKATWTLFETTGTVNGGNGSASTFNLFLLNAGECLIDDIEVIEESSGGNRITNPGFETDMQGWTPRGNHVRSTLDSSEGFESASSLHVRASGAGTVNANANLIEINHVVGSMTKGASAGETLTIRAQVRWQAGWPNIVLSLQGFWLDAAGTMALPTNLGTPGRVNSRHQPNQGPSIEHVQHTPVRPAGNEAVTVSARVLDVDGVAAVLLRYRLNASSTYTTVAMRDDGSPPDETAGDHVYGVTLPGARLNQMMGYYVEAIDNHSQPATNAYPSTQLEQNALIFFGEPEPSGLIGTYSIWMSSANVGRLTSQPTRSNEPVDITFIYDSYRVIHNAKLRYRGNARNYTDYRNAAYSINMPKDNRFLGSNEVKLDIPSRNSSNGTYLQEHHSFWLAKQAGIAGSHLRFVRARVNKSNLLRHDYQPSSGDFVKSWYGDDDPQVYENVRFDPFARYLRSDTGEMNLSRYRYSLQKKKTNVPGEDYSAVFRLINALYLVNSAPAIFEARVGALIDPYGWAGYFALNRVCGNKDSYGWNSPHNMLTYIPVTHRSRLHLHDMDAAFKTATGLWPTGIPNWVFSKPRFRRAYWRLLKNLADGPLRPEVCNPELQGWYDAFRANGFAPTHPQGMMNWNASRRTQILNALPVAALEITSNAGEDFSTQDHIVSLQGTAPIEAAEIHVNGLEQVVSFSADTDWTAMMGLTNGANHIRVRGFDREGNVVGEDSIVVTLTAPPPSAEGQILITEIMYHPLDTSAEFIEIYNRSSDTFDLGGWRLNGVDLIFDRGALIGPGEYRVICEDLQAYTVAYTNTEVVIGDYDGSLDNGGETLTLEMPDGAGGWTTIDRVRYDDSAPWSPWPDGRGPSLQLIDLTQDNNRTANWGAPNLGTNDTWRLKTFSAPANLSNPFTIARTRLHFLLDGPGTIHIDDVSLVSGSIPGSGPNILRDGDFESNFRLAWTAEGTHAASTNQGGTVFSGDFSLRLSSEGAGDVTRNSVSQGSLGLVNTNYALNYRYRTSPRQRTLTVSFDNDSTFTFSHDVTSEPVTAVLYTPGAPNSLGATLPPLPRLWINEILPDNRSVLTDNAGQHDPWIELYNAESTAVDIGGFTLTDDYNALDLWAFPTGTVIEAGGRLLVWADGEPAQSTNGFLHTHFRLKAGPGSIALVMWHGELPLVLDSMDYNLMGPDIALGSYPEGDPFSRIILHGPTPGTVNIPDGPPPPVFINEWMSDNDGYRRDPADGKFEDWFELYNASTSRVDLGGFLLSDTASSSNAFVIPVGFSIPANGFLMVWADNDPEQSGSELHTDFALDSAGEHISFFQPGGALVDHVRFTAQAADRSHGRWPDGASLVTAMSPPTPAASNRVILIRAIEASPQRGFVVDWPSSSGTVYRFEATHDMIETNWALLNIVTAESDVTTFDDPSATNVSIRFYRLVEQ